MPRRTPTSRNSGAGLDQLLSHEQQFWYGSAQNHGLLDGQEKATPQLLRQIIAAGCLLGAATADEAGKLTARVPGDSGQLAAQAVGATK